jgi:hypothetical protein
LKRSWSINDTVDSKIIDDIPIVKRPWKPKSKSKLEVSSSDDEKKVEKVILQEEEKSGFEPLMEPVILKEDNDLKDNELKEEPSMEQMVDSWLNYDSMQLESPLILDERVLDFKDIYEFEMQKSGTYVFT